MGNSLGQTPTHPWGDREQESLSCSTLPQNLERMRKPRVSQGILAPFLSNLILIQEENALSAVPVEVYLRVLATVAQKKLLPPSEEALVA